MLHQTFIFSLFRFLMHSGHSEHHNVSPKNKQMAHNQVYNRQIGLRPSQHNIRTLVSKIDNVMHFAHLVKQACVDLVSDLFVYYRLGCEPFVCSWGLHYDATSAFTLTNLGPPSRATHAHTTEYFLNFMGFQGCHGTGRTGNFYVHFPIQGKHMEFAKILKKCFYTGN